MVASGLRRVFQRVSPSLVVALCAATVGMCASALQQTLLATAAPTIIAELGHPSAYAWIAGAYLLASTIVLPWAGAVTDRIGARPMYLAGMGLFGLATVGVCLSSTLTGVLVFRLVQGIGAGLLVPAALAVVGLLKDDRLRGRAFGLMGLVQVVANVLGPLWGGWGTDALGWRWAMAATVPFTLVGWVLAAMSMPVSPRPSARSSHLPAARPSRFLSARPPYFLSARPSRPSRRWDMLPWGISHGQTGIFFMSFLLGGMMLSAITFLPWGLHALYQLDAPAIGHRLVPLMVAAGVGSILGGFSATRRWTVTGCWLILAAAMALAATGSMTALMLASVAVGVGCGAALPVLLTHAQSQAEPGRVSSVSSLIQFARHAGAALFVPILGLWPAHAQVPVACAGLLASLAIVAVGGLVMSVITATSWRIP